jgi:3-oxoacyl-[acyl-carrier protein] reductase
MEPARVASSEFAGKAVLVTGGTGGIGWAIAWKLAQCGARVAITGRSAERGMDAERRLRDVSPGSFFVQQADAADAESTTAAVATAAELLQGFDLLVSAGAQGTTPPMPFADMSPQQIVSGLESRLLARIFPVHAAVPVLRARGGGAIVMITTDAARHPTAGESIVGAAGASVILLTKVLAREFSRWSIRVNSIALTLTSETPSWDRIFAGQDFQSRLFSKALERFPSGRAPTAEETADAAVFLLGAGALQITGQTLSVNGGLSFGGW